MDYAGRLSRAAVETLLAAVVRFTPLQTVTLNQIKVEHFDAVAEPDFLLMWQAIADVAKRNGGILPPGDSSKAALDLALKAYLEAGGYASVDYNSMLGANGLLNSIFLWNESQFDEGTVRELLQQFIAERNNIRIAALVDANRREGISQARMDEIKQLLDSDNIVSLTEDTIFQAPLPTAADIAELKRTGGGTMTGITWFDKIMGGQYGGQAYTLIGPSGVGKTTIAVMLATYGTRTQQAMFREGKVSKPGYWYIVTYEQPKREVQWRVIANASMVPSEKIKQGYLTDPAFDNLQKPGEPYTAYDQYLMRRLKETPETYPSELERVNRAFSEYLNGIAIIDCSGAVPGLAGATMQEVGAYIKNRVKRGIPCAGVAIDWAGQAVDMQLRRRNSRDEHRDKIMKLSSFVSEATEYIAQPNDCPVWCLHQVKGDMTRSGPTSRRSHADAAMCSTFSHLAYYAYTLGTKDDSKELCCCWASKTRNSGSDPTGTVLKIEGKIAMMRDASREYVIEPTGFVPTNMAERFVDSAKMNDISDAAMDDMDSKKTLDDTPPPMDSDFGLDKDL